MVAGIYNDTFIASANYEITRAMFFYVIIYYYVVFISAHHKKYFSSPIWRTLNHFGNWKEILLILVWRWRYCCNIWMLKLFLFFQTNVVLLLSCMDLKVGPPRSSILEALIQCNINSKLLKLHTSIRPLKRLNFLYIHSRLSNLVYNRLQQLFRRGSLTRILKWVWTRPSRK